MRTPPSAKRQHTPVQAASSTPKRRRGMALLYILTLAVLLGLLIHGFSYYTMPYSARPHHPDYRQLRPAGSWGLIFGITGASMMILMMVYSVRKRMKMLRRVGSLTSWLNLHIYLGFFGPLFIILHTSFKVQGLVAVSFWSMVLVALSGFFGRYLYIQVPRNIQGNELSLQELEALSRNFSQLLEEKFGLDDKSLMALDKLTSSPLQEGMGLFRALYAAVISDLRWLSAGRSVKEQYAAKVDLPKNHLRHLFRLARERSLLKRRIALLSRAQRLFHYWHVAHKPFAVVMYVVMAIHIAVAIWTGHARIL